MASIATTIWQVPAYLPYLQPPLTDDAIANAEGRLGFQLPAEFLELLRVQNGGYIRYSLPDMVHDTIAGIGPYFPSLTDFDWDECQECVSYPLNGLVPFDGDGHWHLCLDYRENASSPSITYVDIECDHQTEIASSFAEYLALLRVDPEDNYVLDGVLDVKTIKSQLSSILEVQFEEPDTWAHGYPIDRAAMGTQSSPEWLWLSPNAVLRGFVRPDDPRYHELKDLMPGKSLRYPEISASSYLLSATKGVVARVLDACNNANLSVRPLRECIDAK